ncbi:unnamed protein product [Soboliphyme baturini]|uniref:Uncharacterized protein n=1 Tax=Soboliphyme baturini TaxID=241478 RepID=A0A183IDK5_9BILA|nr:unnamed protein product [Soboliphyme baturini]
MTVLASSPPLCSEAVDLKVPRTTMSDTCLSGDASTFTRVFAHDRKPWAMRTKNDRHRKALGSVDVQQRASLRHMPRCRPPDHRRLGLNFTPPSVVTAWISH